MALNDVVEKRKSELNGITISESDKSVLLKNLPQNLVPEWFINFLQVYPIINVNFILPEEDDESDMGVDMRWLDAESMVSEATEIYPGKLVKNLGYLPIGSCLFGSGDPYFLKILDNDDPAVFRIPHDEIDEDNIDDTVFEQVSSSLSKFIELAEIHQ